MDTRSVAERLSDAAIEEMNSDPYFRRMLKHTPEPQQDELSKRLIDRFEIELSPPNTSQPKAGQPSPYSS